MNLKKILCSNFKSALEEQGVSTTALAESTGWHRNRWTERTNGTTDIKLEDLVIAAEAMDVSPTWLAIKVISELTVDDKYLLILRELKQIKEGLGLKSTNGAKN